jgi:hypothetical protein
VGPAAVLQRKIRFKGGEKAVIGNLGWQHYGAFESARVNEGLLKVDKGAS